VNQETVAPGPAAPNTLVCVLGMHRSGTSSLAGCLEECGLHLGEVVNSAPHNRKGNKENLPLRAINDDVLALNGGSWDQPPERLNWNDDLRRRRDEHIAGYRSFKIWGFKDPRTVLTLPFWLEAAPNMRLVGTFRHPKAVARSLLRRSGLKPAVDPLDLWKHYNLKLLEYMDQYGMPLVSFDWPPDDYSRAVGKIAHALDLVETTEIGLGFFENELRSNGENGEQDITVEKEQMIVYEKLMKNAISIDDD